MATYYVAADKTDETLTCLEAMLEHVARVCALPRDPAQEHTCAWYFKDCLTHERYDPVREENRFLAIKEKLAALA